MLTARQPCAGGIVFDASSRLLLIQRGTPPAAGSWSLPGGRCRPGESPRGACVREVAEETGLTVAVVRLAGRVVRRAPDGGVYDIDDYLCALTEPDVVPRAGDDAADVGWFARAELDRLELAPGVYAALAGWGLLPA